MNNSLKRFSNFTFIIIFIYLLPITAICQNIVSGVVTESNGNPIEGANVYFEGTYDGASTNGEGVFSFETSETGVQTLTISSVSFETFVMAATINQMQNLKVVLREDVNSLDTVVLSAGTFEASDNSKVSVLKPLDVVTTASALGDFVGALQTLPGTTTVAEDGRLFVRGGDASETQIFIDGVRVFTPYTPTTNNTPTRGRYSPFLFDGITFSTGGYSAEYGQALSSVLLLSTIDEPIQEKTDISIMTVGLGIGNTQKWNKSSLSVNGSYINLAPYVALFPDRNDWQKPFEAISGEAVFRQKFKKGLLKVYAAFDTTSFQLTQEDINVPEGVNVKLNNYNFYTNTSYSGDLGSRWKIFGGASYTGANNKADIESLNVDNTENSAHLKLKLRKRFSSRFKLSFGAEQFLTDFTEDFSDPSFNTTYGFNNNISGIFSEADIIFSRKFAMKLGVRGEYSGAFDEFTVSPRASLAYKTGRSSQLSLAYGDFYQQPNNDILKFNNNLTAQKTQHFIMNYQYSANNRIFRAEAYRKEYNNLVSYNTNTPQFNSVYKSDG
ncbi:MAG: outer membrane cobalamin receptor, partial [Ulvibacter sp.]